MVETPHPEALPSESARVRVHERGGFVLGCECETIRRAQSGDPVAWETLVRQNVGWILRTCSRWAGSRGQAEDLAQDVFIRVFRALPSYRGEYSGFRTWVNHITRNLLIDDYRRKRRVGRTVSFESADEQTQSVLHAVPSSGFSPEASIQRQERRAALRKALRLLDSEMREVVILRDVRGLTYQEISRLLKMPSGTVKSRVHRGRIALVHLMRRAAALPPGWGPSASAVAYSRLATGKAT